MIRLVLTDLDNTLIPHGAPHASMHAIAGIHALLDAGVRFGPVSGRVPAAMRWMFGGDEACSQTGAFVNGQLIYVDGIPVHEELLDGPTLRELAEYLRDCPGCALTVYDLEDISETTDGTAYYAGATLEELERAPRVFGRAPRLLSSVDWPAYIKANVRCDATQGEIVRLRDDLRRRFAAFDFVLPDANGFYIDVLPAGWGKGKSVAVLAQHLGLGLDEIAVFGDSENDLSMLEAVPNSVTVANASPDVARVARWHIGSAEDDAVADALFDIAAAARSGGQPAFMKRQTRESQETSI